MEYLSINAVNLRSESFLRTANWPPDKFDIFKELKKRLRYSIVYKEARQNIFDKLLVSLQHYLLITMPPEHLTPAFRQYIVIDPLRHTLKHYRQPRLFIQ